jgi:CrcB protein
MSLSTSITGRRRLAVAAGGAVGALGRAAVIDAVDAVRFDPLGATFIVNVLGSLVLGYVVARHAGRSHASPFLIPFVGVGILGAFTTFSVFSTEVFELARAGDWLVAIGYPVGSVAVGFVAALLGVRFGGSR